MALGMHFLIIPTLVMKIESLERENKNLKLKNIDPRGYMEWKHEEILAWIMSLEDGRYAKYEEKIRKSLIEESIIGRNLPEVERSDVKGWGILNFEDKKDLVQHFQQLAQQNAAKKSGGINEGAPTAYI